MAVGGPRTEDLAAGVSGQAARWKQPRYAVAGWDAVAAPVTATDWLSSYPHVHSANLGLSASTYLAGGAFVSTTPPRTRPSSNHRRPRDSVQDRWATHLLASATCCRHWPLVSSREPPSPARRGRRRTTRRLGSRDPTEPAPGAGIYLPHNKKAMAARNGQRKSASRRSCELALLCGVRLLGGLAELFGGALA